MPLHRHIVSSTLAMALLGVMAMAAAQTAPHTEKKIYCWNDAGRKICGDALPASATDSARTEFSIKSGMATAHIDRTLNSEERSAAAQAEVIVARKVEKCSAARRNPALAQRLC